MRSTSFLPAAGPPLPQHRRACFACAGRASCSLQHIQSSGFSALVSAGGSLKHTFDRLGIENQQIIH